MNALRFGAALAILTSILVGVLLLAGPRVEQGLAADATRLESPAIPASHHGYLQALQKRRSLNLRRQTAEACLRDLSRTLGMDIQLHESVQKRINKEGTANITTAAPVSHQTAIQLVMTEFSIYQYGIVLGGDQLTLVAGDGYQGHSLQTYDFFGRSNISIAMRRREIQSLLNHVEPDSWTAENKTWIREGESITEIDVYQSQKAHNEISRRTNMHGMTVEPDQDVQSLSVFTFIRNQKAGKKIDKEAIVKRLRKKYGYRSMAERLAHEATTETSTTLQLSREAEDRLRKADEQFEKETKSKFVYSRMRRKSLQLLHEAEVETFVGRPGAGLSRMPPPGPSFLPGSPPRNLPLATNEMVRSADELPVRLPEDKVTASTRRVFLPSRAALRELHQTGESTFLSTASFGYVKSREEVAGFQPHGFAHAPNLLSHIDRPWYRKEKELWAMHRLELVSLLKHSKPAVYASRSLPSMKELQDAKTRNLNGFEHSALDELRAGEDVVTKASLNRIEMLGSLRATKQCLQCHEVKRGALLGAFSYELLRDPQLDPGRLPAGARRPIF